MGVTPYVARGATISPDQRYRYRLWREWRQLDALIDDLGFDDGEGKRVVEPQTCVFVMLNPSTADGSSDDPTIRRCVGFAKLWGFCRLEVINLFAYRTPSPDVLLALTDRDDPVGPDNRDAFDDVLRNQRIGRVVCAWGTDGGYLDQARTAYGWLIRSVSTKAIVCLGRTKGGFPRHPLYVSSRVNPEAYAA